MRRWWLVLVVGCHSFTAVRPHHDEPGCKIADTLVDVGPGDADAPLVMVYEHHSFAASEVRAIWSDGAIVETRERALVQGTMPAADAQRLAARVAADLARSPGYAELGGPVDQPRVEIIARDGTRWRHAELWGAGHAAHDEGPDGFLDAYRALLAVVPARVTTFAPADLALTFTPTDTGEPPLAWPDEIPHTAVVEARYEPALRTLLAQVHATVPPHPVTFDGKLWLFAMSPRTRGQALTDRVWACVATD